MEDRITELETRIAFQEHSLQELSDEMYRQQKQIERLDNICRMLLQQMQDVSAALPAKPLDEKPPHY
ncbi:MAG TPA: SlyX family protein [Candidatus Kapabacteria bacterium]|nr:SlyX family protein [Candidatus Kapabacteria bacterium]